MKKKSSFGLRAFVAIGLFLVYHLSVGQTTTVFSDDFSTPNATLYTVANGPISGSSIWTMNRSGANNASAIANSLLYLTNNGTTGANFNGWVVGYTSTGSFASPYTTTLANNIGALSWSFNMRQDNTNPEGFTDGAFGAAFILAGTNGTTNLTGTGYAVVLGNSGTTDPIRLVRYNNGIRNHTTLITSNTAGLTDFGNQYLSIRVVYIPSTNTWELFLRNDGTSGFVNPVSGTLISQGSVINDNYTNTVLPLMGGYFNGGSSATHTVLYNSLRVTIAVPFITSLTPNSKVAGTGNFTLTVNGQNFRNTNVVRWNGVNRTTTYVSPTQLTAAIPASDIVTSGTATVTVAQGTVISNSEVFTIDPAGVPNLTTSTASINVPTTANPNVSGVATYTISGANLTADPVTVTAPANLEVSLNNTTFSNSLTLTRSGNTLSGEPVTIYVRTKANTTAGVYNTLVTNTAPGAATKNVTVNATVLAAEPSNSSTSINFTGITSTSFTVNWTTGNGANRLVLVRQGGAVNSSPLDGQSYVSGGLFGSGSQIGSGNFVVYSANGSSATISGLSPSTPYHVSIFEFNGTGGLENYRATGLIGNTTTLAAPAGWQIYTANTLNTINFDVTVDGVNSGVFQAEGITTPSQAGQLNSGAWAFTGFSSGALAFGASSAPNSDYDRGISTGGVSQGGLYAFETISNNFSLGIQPAGGNFTPGTIILRIQNQTGSTITSLNVGYKVFIYNDQPSSSSFNFSYSNDNSVYIPATILNTVSPAVADETPYWRSHYRVSTITGLNIAPNANYYLRWDSATVSGTTSFDEFALDDIMLIANPSSNVVPFSGTADSFVLNGNATMSSNLEILENLTFNGGKLRIGSNTLTSIGTITNTTTAGIIGSASSNLIINGIVNNTLSLDQTNPGTTNLLNNLVISTTSANTTTVSNAIAVNGNLNISTDQLLNLGPNALTGTLSSITLNGTLQTANTSALPLPSGKNWLGNGTVHYNAASSVQTVVPGTYNGLIVSSTAGSIAGGALTVNGNLQLPSANPSATLGSLSMGSFELLMGGDAYNSGIGDVTGDVIRNSIASNVLYTFGHQHTSIIFPSIGTLPTSMGLRIQIGTAPTWLPGAIQRIYDFKQTGGTGTKAIIKAHYLDSELNGNNDAALVDYAYIVGSGTVLEQGRSNFNATENWVELTNVNVGVFFQPTFEQVKLTLDESALPSLTWNGNTSNSWTTASNWTPNASPSDNTIVYIPDTATTNFDPLINPTTLIGKVTIFAGGIVNAPDGSQFTVNGAGGAWINNGTFNPGVGSTVSFTNLDATIAGETNFNNLTINTGAGLRPQTGNIMHISGVFTRLGIFSPGAVENTVDFTGTNQTVPQVTTGLEAYNNLTITGSGAVFPSSLNITGNLKLNNTVDFTGKTIVMKGLNPQTISGSTNPVFNNLTIANTDGNVSVLTNSNVNGTLTLTSGQLIVHNTILNLGTNPVAGTFDQTRMIVTSGTGEVRKPFTGIGSYFFPIGENDTPAYAPIAINITSGTFASAYVGVSVKDGKHPDNYSLQNHLIRYWDVNQSGITNAVATITANFLAEDATADVSTIAAAQLSGPFNLNTNPWIKFETLSGTVLSVVGASLTPGVTSSFTGIKGGDFSVILSGFGAFCEDEVVTLTALTSGGDAPYNYAWSGGLGNLATASPPTDTVGTQNYTLTVRDANGLVANDQADVTVLTPSLGGNLSASQLVCLRSAPQNITLTGHTGNVLYWQRSEDPTFATGVTNLSNFTDVLYSENAGIILATTYFRAVISNGDCPEVFSGTTSAIIQTTTWNGTWTNGVPNALTNVVLTEDFTPSADFAACSVTIQNGADIIIPTGISITVNGAMLIDSGSFTLQDDASLVQTDDSTQNIGTNFTMYRNTEPMYRYDYTYWSSPVNNQTLYNLSPTTLLDKYLGWNQDTQSWISYLNGNHVMEAGRGYAVRAPQTFSTNPFTVTSYLGAFNGTPNNGIVRVQIAGDDAYNLLGNPYPSAIDADSFLLDSNNSILEGTIYLWTHHTPVAPNGAVFSYSADDYAVYNLLGGVGTAAPSLTNPTVSDVPTGYIAAGQGFFIQGTTDGNAVFNNDMRITSNNNQFFKSASLNQKSRLWISISNAEHYKQQLIGYAANATNDYDKGWDGELMQSSLDFYSFVADKKLSIQSFQLPFADSQVIPIGFKTTLTGFHSIDFNDNDGLFVNQNVYLKDNVLNVIHDLKADNYEFTTTAGTFDDRFEIIYTNSALGNPEFTSDRDILVYKQQNTINVKSYQEAISSIRIIDMQGRIIHILKDINNLEASFKIDLPNQVLIIDVETTSGKKYNKKMIH